MRMCIYIYIIYLFIYLCVYKHIYIYIYKQGPGRLASQSTDRESADCKSLSLDPNAVH